jgi:HSP20 family protein
MAIRDLVPWKRDKAPARREEEQDPFIAFRNEVDRTFNEFFGSRSLAPWGRDWTGFDPKVDVIETEAEVKVEAELPGLEAEDVHVTVSHNVLSIRGEKKHQREEKGENWFRTERSYGSFERAIPLPQGTDTENADAAFDKGVLTITFAKTAKVGPAKIKVKAR